jgi:hypothetical protein
MRIGNPDHAHLVALHENWWRYGGAKPNLIGANLIGANLIGANLRGANLRGANLTEPVARLDFGGWSICVRAEHASIGCQTRANEDWLSWGPSDVEHMAVGASEWWGVHGDAIKAVIRCVMAKAAR